MAKFCGKCGKPLTQNAQFCIGCGTKIEIPTVVEPTVEPFVEDILEPAVESVIEQIDPFGTESIVQQTEIIEEDVVQSPPTPIEQVPVYSPAQPTQPFVYTAPTPEKKKQKKLVKETVISEPLSAEDLKKSKKRDGKITLVLTSIFVIVALLSGVLRLFVIKGDPYYMSKYTQEFRQGESSSKTEITFNNKGLPLSFCMETDSEEEIAIDVEYDSRYRIENVLLCVDGEEAEFEFDYKKDGKKYTAEDSDTIDGDKVEIEIEYNNKDIYIEIDIDDDEKFKISVEENYSLFTVDFLSEYDTVSYIVEFDDNRNLIYSAQKSESFTFENFVEYDKSNHLIHRETYQGGDLTYFYDAEYDGDKLVKTVIKNDDEKTETIYEHDNKDRIVGYKSYQDDELYIYAELKSSDKDSVELVKYDNDNEILGSEIYYYQNNVLTSVETYNYYDKHTGEIVYDRFGHIIEEHKYSYYTFEDESSSYTYSSSIYREYEKKSLF